MLLRDTQTNLRPRLRSVASTVAAVMAVFAIASQAHASVLTVGASVGGAPTGVNYVNFNNLALGSGGGSSGGVTVSFTPNGQVVNGSKPGYYAAPYLSNGNGTLFGDTTNGPDTTNYLTTGLGTVTVALPGEEKYVGLLWGSVDTYNTLTLYNNSTLVGTVTGSDVTANANGDQGADGTFYVNINSTTSFNSIVASSTQYAFEFDNLAYNSTIPTAPEPGTLALLGVGLGLVGFAAASRRKRPNA